jgi:predicted NBD/HSP70 family sugar kinase
VSYVLGADLGATNLRIALGAGDGVVRRIDGPVPPTGEALAATFAAFARGEPVRAAALGVPGVPDGDGFGVMIAGAAGLTGAPLRSLLEQALGVPVTIENDLNLAALAEAEERDVDDLVFVGVGTGVGMGIVAGGRLLRGAAGAAGELGHLPFGGREVAGADGMGPLEAVAGGAGLAARWGGGSGREVFEAAERGDARAAALLDDQARALATGIRAVRALLDPALVVLGGGIGCRADVAERVGAALGEPVETSALGELAGLTGALRVAQGSLTLESRRSTSR